MCQSWLLCLMLVATATAAAAAAPLDSNADTGASASASASAGAGAVSASSPYPRLTQMATSEFAVDRDGLWTNTEVPLSDASMRAIRESTLASPQDESDVATTVLYTATTAPADEMETSAVDENENNNMEVGEDGIDSENELQLVPDDHDSERETSTTLDDDHQASSDSETSATEEDTIDIASGPHGRMILIPRSSRLEMDPLVNHLTRIISELKQHSPLDRITLKLEIEPIVPRIRRDISIPRMSPSYPRPPPRARPISLRLIPSRSQVQTRAMLARCRMLLRQALQKLKRMKLRRAYRRPSYRRPYRRIPVPRIRTRAPFQKPRMTDIARWLRRVGRGGGVTILDGNRFKRINRSNRRISHGNIDVEAEHNSTARVFAPSIALRLNEGSMLVVNRGVIVIVNRSANNTLSVAPPPPSPRRRRMYPFMTSPSHLELSAAAVNAAPAITIEPALAMDAAHVEDTPSISTSTSTPNEN